MFYPRMLATNKNSRLLFCMLLSMVSYAGNVYASTEQLFETDTKIQQSIKTIPESDSQKDSIKEFVGIGLFYGITHSGDYLSTRYALQLSHNSEGNKLNFKLEATQAISFTFCIVLDRYLDDKHNTIKWIFRSLLLTIKGYATYNNIKKGKR